MLIALLFERSRFSICHLPDHYCMLPSPLPSRYVFGITTTYKEWAIHWLPDTTPMAMSSALHIAEQEGKDSFEDAPITDASVGEDEGLMVTRDTTE